MTANDWILIISALTTMFVTIIGAIGAVMWQLRQNHTLLDGRMEQLLRVTQDKAVAETRLQSVTEPDTVKRPDGGGHA